MNETAALAHPEPEGNAPISPRLTVSELVRIYTEAERDILEGFAKVAAAEHALQRTFDTEGTYVRVGDRHHYINYDEPERILKNVRRSVWISLVDHLEIRRFASVEAWKTLEKQLHDDHDVPEITIDTVTQMVEQFRARLPEMLRGAIREVHDWLRPHNDRYKRNSQFEIPSKVILTWVVGRSWSGDGFRVHDGAEQQLSAMERVFTALDGKGEVSKTHYSMLSSAIRASGKSGRGQTEYFAFRACKNRNLHLEFLRPDLLERLNRIAGGKRLRGERKPG